MNHVCTAFCQRAEREPERIAVHHRQRDWSYGELRERATAVASWLRQGGLQHGARVGLLLPNSAEYVACYLGVQLAGGVAVTLNPNTTPRELSHTLVHSQPAAVVVAPGAEEPLAAVAEQLTSLRLCVVTAPDGAAQALARVSGRTVAPLGEVWDGQARGCLPQLEPSDLAQIIYTSGTSGRPKGVTLSHRNLAANCSSILEYLELTPSDSVFVVLPFFYSYGNSLLTTHLVAGGRLVLAANFAFWNPALDLMEVQRATGFAGVPSSFAMLLRKSDFARRSFRHLRYMTCAGGGLAPALAEQLRTLVPHARLFLMYGQTEATARLATLLPEDLPRKLGSIGMPIPGVKLAVLDDEGRPVAPGEVGEIVAQGDSVMVGYWNDAAATRDVLRPEGLRTGDLASVDADGYLYVVGRKSDLIKSGDHRIHPEEIEILLLELPGVAEAAVCGLPDEILGAVPAAFVVPAARQPALTVEEALAHANRNLPRHKQLRHLQFVAALPRTASGKVQRSELRGLTLAPDARPPAAGGEPGLS